MRGKKVCITGILLLGLLLCRSVFAEETKAEIYQRDYIQQVYQSQQGLEGSAANCIYSADDGVLWIGSYTGLFSYDSRTFASYEFGGYSMSVKALTQDRNGTLWVGTNGNGLYYYRNEAFAQCMIDSSKNLASTINRLCVDSEGKIWAATKAGLFMIDQTGEEPRAVLADRKMQDEIRDLCILSDGRMTAVTRSGRVFLGKAGNWSEVSVPQLEEGVKIRCAGAAENGAFYLGTNDTQLCRMSRDGSLVKILDGGELSSFNRICSCGEGEFWVCTDSGIGILSEDRVEKVEFPLNNSVEDMCRDYQGNYWFASSKLGLLHIYENYFSDLRNYLNLNRTVNSIEVYQDRLYIGTDEGLLCYEGREQVQDELTELCNTRRIRQLYRDSENNLWIVTYRNGLIRQAEDGSITSINTENSGLSTDEMRCICERTDGTFLVGSEAGIYTIDTQGTVKRLVEQTVLNTERILALAEDEEGTVFAGTDGDGLFIIKDGTITDTVSASDGLYTNVILKIRPSLRENGIWVVTGAGICFVGKDKTVTKSTGTGIANSLDLIFLNDEEVAVLAGNGFFRMEEKDLLNGDGNCIFYDKQLGLPVDFTANSWSQVRDGVLYLCGTEGAASLIIDRKPPVREIRTYIRSIEQDGTSVPVRENSAKIDEWTHRLNLDIRVLNYTHEEYKIGYCLDGTDRRYTYLDENSSTNISYTNLRGGDYNYHFIVLDKEKGRVLASRSIFIRKNRSVWEDVYARLLLALLLLCSLGALVIFIVLRKDRQIQERYRRKFLQEKNDELKKIAYQDLVTGVSNRNLYEIDKENLDMDRITALVTVSINHAEYICRKKGLIFYEDMLKKTVELMERCAECPIRIYRISEYVFCFWSEEDINLEVYTAKLKEAFREQWKEDHDVSDLAVGAVYRSRLLHESRQDLFRRCDQMRNMDQKHGEMKFMERKIEFLNKE